VVHTEPAIGLGPHVDLELADALVELPLERWQRRLVAVVGAAHLHIVHANDAIARERLSPRRAAAARRGGCENGDD
jgi:hypothetical protein